MDDEVTWRAQRAESASRRAWSPRIQPLVGLPLKPRITPPRHLWGARPHP
jgi:hypothetical protein